MAIKRQLYVNDVQIYYEEYGAGEPIIFLHGNGQNIKYFKKQIQFFSREFRVIAVDSRGHGNSTDTNSDYNYEILADDLLRVMNSLKIEKAHIVGWSDGGITGLIFATKHISRILSLSIMGANFDTKGLKLSVRMAVSLAYYISKPLSFFSKKMAGYNKRNKLMKTQPHITFSELQKITTKVLIIVGSNDFIKDIHTSELAQNIENAQVLVIKNSDHFAPLKKTKEFNEAILKFIKQT